jgi:type VI secretion system secreted protein VgrG
MTDFRLYLDPDPDAESQVVLHEDEILAFRLYERLTGQEPTLDRDKAELAMFAPDDAAPESIFAQGHIRHTPPILGNDPVVQPPAYLRILVTPPRLPDGVRVPDLINQPARLSLTDESGATRHVRGLIQRALNRTGAYGRSAALELQIYPWLWAMALSQKCRVWTNVTSVDVLEQLVREYALELPDAPRVDASALAQAARRRSAVIQWHESDFEFFSRLLERDGIFLHLVHDRDMTRIHLSDTRSQGGSIHGAGRELQLIGGDRAGDELFADAVTHLTAQREAVPRQYTVADYNPAIADTPLRQSSPPEVATAQSLYDYPGEVTALEEVPMAARRRYQAIANRHEVIHAAGRSPFLIPGSVHTAPSPWDPTEDDWQLRITQAVHELLRDDAGKPVYRCWTSAIAGDTQFAPSQRTPIPSVEGTHNATVVSRSAETVDVDEHSRALVVFHWDPTRRPVRARLGQPWSGTSHGMHVLPRHGDEVLVGFVQGSAEAPVILTNVHNSTTPKWLNPVQSKSDTFDLEHQAVPGPSRQNRYVTALHNQSGNQIAASDETKAEKVKIKAEKDFDLEVGHKAASKINVQDVDDIEDNYKQAQYLDVVFKISDEDLRKWEVQWIKDTTVSLENATSQSFDNDILFAHGKPSRPDPDKRYAIPIGTQPLSDGPPSSATVFANQQPIGTIYPDPNIVPTDFEIYKTNWELKEHEAGDFETRKDRRGSGTIRTYGDLTIYVGKLTDSMEEYAASNHQNEVVEAGGSTLDQAERGGMYTYVMGGTTHTVRGAFAFVTHPAEGYLLEAEYKSSDHIGDKTLACSLGHAYSASASHGTSADFTAGAGFEHTDAFGASFGGSGSYDVGFGLSAANTASILDVDLTPTDVEVKTPGGTFNAAPSNDEADALKNESSNGIVSAKLAGFLVSIGVVLQTFNIRLYQAASMIKFHAARYTDLNIAGKNDEAVKAFLRDDLPRISRSMHILSAIGYAAHLALGAAWAITRVAEFLTLDWLGSRDYTDPIVGKINHVTPTSLQRRGVTGEQFMNLVSTGMDTSHNKINPNENHM